MSAPRTGGPGTAGPGKSGAGAIGDAARILLGVTGWSGSGKTALIVRLIPELSARGFRIATVKRAHHVFDIDTPGKDSYEHRAAGAIEVAVTSARRWAILHENIDEPEPSLDQIVARMSPADLFLIEGFKTAPHPKIEVWRAAAGTNLICRTDPSIVAVATDGDPAGLVGIAVPVLDLNDAAAIADFVVAHCRLGARLRGAL